ncbi:putative helicase mov-10-B.1 [Condylostylus longicornis]|uniref:putative helicase mov-10-B.1 n=1 Tax=Condylostylus longicornis TaxID=2530218 RepID=UPI00244DEF41|nr:putative helicase mov-10-B.1 [Condylostylus longicornis]
MDGTAIKKFIVYLYHKNIFNEETDVFSITKSNFISKLASWESKKNLKINEKLEEILRDGKLIIKKSNEEDVIVINKTTLLEYENYFLNELDRTQINEAVLKHTFQENDKITRKFSQEKQKLEFKTCVLIEQSLGSDSDISCEICTLKFQSKDLLEEHLELHISTSNFEWIIKNQGSPFPRFQIFCQISEDSDFLKFTLSTQYSGISLSSVATARSTDILCLVNHKDNERIIDEGGSYEFVIDKHVFIKSIEQPIYVTFHMFVNTDQNQREKFVELHTILPSLFLSRKMLNGGEIKQSQLKTKKGVISEHFPRESLRELYSMKNFTENDLFSISRDLRKFCTEDDRNLTPCNICEVFKFLLEMEDIEIEKCYLNFTQTETQIHCVRRTKKELEYSIKLSNLPEGEIFQDTINCGDELILICSDTNIAKELNVPNEEVRCARKLKYKYFGIISNIYGTTVYFECRKDKIDISKKYDVKFRPNRRNFLYQYSALNAIDQYSLISVFLFPEDDKQFNSCATISMPEIDIFDVNVENNPEQKEAVLNIVNGIKYFLPYIIVGPPGTGKTTTIVESILQLQIKKPEEKILVTAGSNAACNEIAKRLIKIKNSQFADLKIFRLFSKSSEKSLENIDKDLIENSNLSYGYHFFPSLESIQNYNVLICTTSLVGRLKASGLVPSNYTYCFIDECAASTEPEVLVAVEAVFHSNIKIIIAGDPKQLGPILHSKLASEYGLKISLLERLLNRKCYRVNDDRMYNRTIQTRLVRNFRTHPGILSISNKLFYSNDLIACANIDLTHWAIGWNNLPQKELPLIFHHVSGHTKQDMYSHSLFNLKEVNIVMEYVKKLMYFHINGRKIKEEDIGVISPYRKQNIIIREELNKRKWYKIATGSVETFQGQEKPVIIISTVRSQVSDRQGVGFLVNEKRLNVMLTRAQALLIIVGNTKYLSDVPNWKESIQYCSEENVLIDTTNEDNDINNKLSNDIENISLSS